MMLRLASGQISPPLSIDGPRLSNAFSFSSSMIDGMSRKIVNYDRLPEEPIRLCVRKLDGSSFDIDVSKKATIAELKMAVEAAFHHMPKEGPGKISWPHVWGHFCLCFEGQKLIVDSDYIKHFQIRDGDQLEFVRHISSKCNLKKMRSKHKNSDHQATEQDESPSSSSFESEHDQNKLNDDFEFNEMEIGKYKYLESYDDINDGQDCWNCMPKNKSRPTQARFDCGLLFSFRKSRDRRQFIRSTSWHEQTKLDMWTPH